MLKITSLLDSSVTNRSMMLCELQLSGPYTEGGEVLTPNMVGLGDFDTVLISSKGGYVLEYDQGKVKAYVAPGEEVTGELNLDRVAAVFIGC